MIYFLRAGDDGPVKIGWTKDGKTLARRIATLQTGQPHKLAILRTLEAQRWVEGWLHGFFVGVRMAGEWFTYREDMLAIEPPLYQPKTFRKSKSMQALGMDAIDEARAFRRAQRMTQAEFAAQFGLPLQTYRQWENGRRRPDMASQVLLRIIVADPETVKRALALEALAAREGDGTAAE